MYRVILIFSLFLSFTITPVAFAGPVKDQNAVILRVEKKDAGSTLKLAIGSLKGVSKETKGYLVDSAGNRVANGSLTIVSVEKTSCVASVSLDSKKIDGSFGVVLQLP